MKEYTWRFHGEEYEGTKKYVEESLTNHANDQIGEEIERLLGGVVIYQVTAGPGGKVVEKAFRIDVTATVKIERDERFDPKPEEDLTEEKWTPTGDFYRLMGIAADLGYEDGTDFQTTGAETLLFNEEDSAESVYREAMKRGLSKVRWNVTTLSIEEDA